MIPYIQILLTIFGAGLMAYIGVRVALATIITKVQNLENGQISQDNRLDRLESPYFSNREWKKER